MYDVFIVSSDETPSAGDAPPPSAGDELGSASSEPPPSATDAPPSAPRGNELDPLTKSNSLTKSIEILSNDNTAKADDGF